MSFIQLEENVTSIFTKYCLQCLLCYFSEPHNDPGWYAPEESDSVHAEMNFGVPLLMKALPVFMTKNTLKVGSCSI